MRALKAPGSRHVVFKYRFNSCKASVALDTFPKVMSLAFPGVRAETNRTDWYVTFPDVGSELWFSGLDEGDRVENILGKEFATVYLNECSQIPYTSRNIAITRLAQKATQVIDGVESTLKPRAYYDENPPSKAHWTYKLFIQGLDPDTNRPIAVPEDYAFAKINPIDNEANLPSGYVESLQQLSANMRRRFLYGEFTDANPNALFHDHIIEKHRVMDGQVPQLVRVVVAVDPSGAGDKDNERNDPIGIVAAGLGTDGRAYILEDATVLAGPATWGRVAGLCYDRHGANVVVGEDNYGGAMVRHVIQTARPNTPYVAVKATRGKHVRADPISALYEQGKIRHVGVFRELEEELTSFSTMGYMGDGSPNRADALIWAVYELFNAIVQPKPVQRFSVEGFATLDDMIGY